ncbi:MAG: glycosyltransferase family 39 protein [Burkholderiales bacterium]
MKVRKAGDAASVAAALVVIVLFARCAAQLVAYPWDWSPDEGLFLDWGRRLVTDPASLYAKSFVPYPAAYGPGLPALLAPFAGLGERMLAGARLLALGWSLVSALAVYVLVKRPAGPVFGIAAAALALAAFDVSFWLMLVRPDGPMIALWLLAAIPLLPARLEGGGDRLTHGRLAAGSLLVLAAVLTKPTAVVHAAPIVLGWLLVDRRSFLRLVLLLGALGLLSLGLLQLATAGGFLWLQRVWSTHGTMAGLMQVILVHSLGRMWPFAAFAALSGALAFRATRRAGPLFTDGAWLLVLGAAVVVPLLSKYGASWNYLVPMMPALVVLACRWLAVALPAGAPGPRGAFGPALTAATAIALVFTRPFPLPTALDRRTADAFYAFVKEHTRRSGGPILAMRPELAKFVVGQPVEMEGSTFVRLARHNVAGSELLLQRLREGRYTLLVELHALPDTGGYLEAKERNYVHAGGCNLSFYFATAPVHLFTRRDLPLYFTPPADTRCGGPAAAAAASPLPPP